MSQHETNQQIQFNKNNGINEVTAEEVQRVQKQKPSVLLIDVRGKEEFHSDLGHVVGAQLATLGPELTQFLEKTDRHKEIIFICRSGGRSGKAYLESLQMGFKSTYSMQGGMLRWNDLQLPKEK